MGSDSEILKKLEEISDACSKCGKCRAVCPTYGVSLTEGMSARGRLELVRAIVAGELPKSKRAYDYFLACIRCNRCSEACPLGLAVPEAVTDTAFAIAEEVGIPWHTRLVTRFILPRRRLLNLFVRIQRPFAAIFFRRGDRAARRLPFIFGGKRTLPPLSPKPFLSRFAGELPASGEPKYRDETPAKYALGRRKLKAAFFVGCLNNYSTTETAEAVKEVFDLLGIDLVVPEGQLCCGCPVSVVGDLKAFRRLAERNIAAFRGLDVDAIVTACPSGLYTLKEVYPRLFRDIDGVEAFAEKTRDVTEFLHDTADLGGLPKSAIKTTYHDPCHSRQNFGIKDQPRDILRSASDFTEMADADACCGNAGLFCLLFPDLSEKITATKIENVREARADVLCTDCPGCSLHITDSLRLMGDGTPVKHSITLLRDALREKSDSARN